MTEQAQTLFLSIARSLIISGIILALGLVALRLWRSAVRRLAGSALTRVENLPRERQLKIQTLAAVSEASGTVVLAAVAGLMVLGQFTDVAPLLAGVGVVGVAVGLGAQSLIRDVISGFFILLENQFAVGDVIKVNDQYAGYVEHLDLRRTVLRNLDGWVITIPNGEIQVVANMTKEWSRMVVDVDVAYQEDVDRVMQTLERVSDELLGHPDAGPLLLERPEILGVERITQQQITIRTLLKTQPMKQWDVGRHYRALIKKAFDREGIQIPFPHRVVILRSVDSSAQEERVAAETTAR